MIEIKGRAYSLREALENPHYEIPSLVIGIFVRFLDIHVNRIPYPGRRPSRELDSTGDHVKEGFEPIINVMGKNGTAGRKEVT